MRAAAILAAGGLWGSSAAEAADATAWTPTGGLEVARDFATATPLRNGKVLVAGGRGGSGYLSSAELYDDVPVETDAFVEDPADVLIRVSEHLDLLICGSRGYGPVRAVLLGGVSRRLTAEAQCPVIVLPRGVKASLDALMDATPGATAAG